MSEWEFDELGAYLPAISLPVFLNNLTVKNSIMGFKVTRFEQFTKHTEIDEINTTIRKFSTKPQVIIDSETEQELCQKLL
jgi:hypothetical protein